LTSVPFNQAVATRFITYLNQTWQFQSTIPFLKSPPTTYQQPAVDLLKVLERIQDRVTADSYSNQYAFEVDVQKLVLSAHDAHFSLYAGILDAFTFASPNDIVSVSRDGKEQPKVYFYGITGPSLVKPIPLTDPFQMISHLASRTQLAT
jgi:hypothetical protein